MLSEKVNTNGSKNSIDVSDFNVLERSVDHKSTNNTKGSTENSDLLVIPFDKFMEGYFYDVTQYIETKQNLEYLSWSYAFYLLKQLDSELFIEFKDDYDNDGLPYSVPAEPGGSLFSYYTMPFLTNGIKKTPPLLYPILDYRNKPLSVMDTASYNKSRMRGAVKVVALYTGIGLTLFTREHTNDESDFADKLKYINYITKASAKYNLPEELLPKKGLSTYSMEETKNLATAIRDHIKSLDQPSKADKNMPG